MMARASKSGTFYTIIGCKSMIDTTTECDTKLLHTRLGHMSGKGMNILASRSKFLNLKIIDVKFCESCVFGKQKKLSFTKTKKSLKDD